MKKIILLFVMMLTVAGVQAKTDKYTCNVTLGNTKDSNASYSDGIFSWSQTNSNKMLLFDNLLNKVDISKYKYLVVKVNNRSDNVGFRLMVMCGGNVSTSNFTETYTQDEVKIDLTSLTYNGNVNVNSSTVAAAYSNINKINIAGSSSATGSLSISASDVYLETEEYEAMTITTTLNSSSTDSKPFAWTFASGTSLTQKNFGNDVTAGSVVWGYANNIDTSHGYFDVTGYDKAVPTITSGTGVLRYLNEGSAIETSATADISSISKITSIKVKDNSITVSSIDFVKEFAAASTSDFNIAASTSSTINYDREFTTGQNVTICLPFSLDKSEMDSYGTFYYLESVSSGNLVFKKASNSVSAYTPYIFVPKSSGKLFENLTAKAIVASSEFSTKGTVSKSDGAWVFKGTLAHVNDVASANSSNTVYGWSSTDGTFKKAGTGVSIDAFRAYIIGPANSSPAKLTAVLYDDTTGIEVVKGSDVSAKASDAMYNLQGQRVGEGHKGLVIKNGKKIFLK